MKPTLCLSRIALLLAAGSLSCGPSRHHTLSSSPNPPAVRFVEISQQVGIDFRHENGAAGKKYMPETMGSGVALFDYDNDGWLDLLFVNGTHWPENRAPRAARRAPHATPRLYRNRGDGTFTDVTREAGLDIELYGMGIAVGDYDNDGWPDLYLTALGPNVLLHNEAFRRSGVQAFREGKPERLNPRTPEHRVFRDVTRQAGVEGRSVPGFGLRWKWSTSAAWLDYDKDGRLDLFVCNYVEWSPKTDIFCGYQGVKGYCAPHAYPGVPCTLYRNEGDGRFRDVSEETGIRGAKAAGKSLGVAVADFNDDGWPDIAVANDTWPNFLFINEEGRRFVESGVDAGIAFGESGKAKAGMGIDAADWNNCGRFGLLIGNFYAESLSLYENDGRGYFTDQARPSGLAEASFHFLTFGLFFFDFDLDGRLDALTANGHIDDQVAMAGIPELTYEERMQLYRNLGGGKFAEVGEACGPDMAAKQVGRGAAFGDVDNDGDLDFALLSNGRRGLLYRNEGGNANRWIRFRLVGVKSNRDGIGALVRVTVGEVTQSQCVRSGGSYLSESQRELTFGLGTAEQIDRVEVRWPSGEVTVISPLQANRQYVVTEGRGATEERRQRSARQHETAPALCARRTGRFSLLSPKDDSSAQTRHARG